jgi:predicted permease
MKTIWYDIRFGLRQLRKSPVFTAIAVLSLALGIGANTAIFSLINGILLKSLPVRNPHELRLINWTAHKKPHLNKFGSFEGNYGYNDNREYCGSFPYPAYKAFAEQVEGFSDLFAISFEGHTVTISTVGPATLAIVRKVSGNFFKGYGAQVLIGRPITPEDDRPGAVPVAVITYDLWERAFGLDPHVLGQTLALKEGAFTVIGVLPRNFVDPLVLVRRADFYVPMVAQSVFEGEDWLNSDNAWWVQIMGRLAPGINDVQVQASMELLFSHVINRSEAILEKPGIFVQEGCHGIMMERREMAHPLWFLQGVVGVVLLIACTNLAGLLLARGTARQHEMAVRAAMGARRWRLIRQSLTESLILSLAGVCLGLIFSLWIRTTLSGLIIDQRLNLQVDTNVLVFTMILGVVTAFLSGLFPALRAGSTDPLAGLKDSGSRGAPRLRLGKVLVTIQVGLSVLLVVAAGLLCRTLINLYQTDTGFDTENILLVEIQPSKSLSELGSLGEFHSNLRQKIAAIPGVQSVALSNSTLLHRSRRSPNISIPGRPDIEEHEAEELVVSDKYFATMGIHLLQGREFDSSDTWISPRIAVVNEKFARLFFPEENPLGQFFPYMGKQWQIVGVCSNHIHRAIRQDVPPIFYLPHQQVPGPNFHYAIRTVLPALSLIPAVRKAVAEVDRNLPLEKITTQRIALKESIAKERLYAPLCGSLAVLAVLLSCIGLYGIMAYNVARRTGEMGIRKALGALPWDVAWPILREALILAVIGVAIGLPVALTLVRLIKSVVYGIKPYDPLTMIGAAGLMIVVAVFAAWIPARRAAKVDPMEALRYE